MMEMSTDGRPSVAVPRRSKAPHPSPPLSKGAVSLKADWEIVQQFDSANYFDGSLQSLHRLAAVPLPLTREVLVLCDPLDNLRLP